MNRRKAGVSGDVSTLTKKSRSGILFRKAVQVVDKITHIGDSLPERDATMLQKWCGYLKVGITTVDMFGKRYSKNQDFIDWFDLTSYSAVGLKKLLDPYLLTLVSEEIQITDHSRAFSFQTPLGKVYSLPGFEEVSKHDNTKFRLFLDRKIKIDDLCNLVWDHHKGRIRLSGKIEASDCNAPSGTLYGKQAEILDTLVTNLVRKQHKTSLSYLFIGPPGTGKSQMALLVAKKLHQRIMVMSSTVFLTFMEEPSFHDFVLGYMKPDIVMVDDIDHSSFRFGGDETLAFYEDTRKRYPGTVFMTSVNEVRYLPQALVRPGRMDQVIFFDEPDAKERLVILRGCLEDQGLTLSQRDQARLVKATAGLTGSFLRETVRMFERFKHLPKAEQMTLVLKQLRDQKTTWDMIEVATKQQLVRVSIN